MTYRILSQAEAEYAAALDYDVLQSPQAAGRFIEEVELAMEEILVSPNRWPLLSVDIRHKRVNRFPYSILYRQSGQEIVVISVADDRREPGFWQSRTS